MPIELPRIDTSLPPRTVIEHVFNDDLLINPADSARAETLFPKLKPILEFSDLQATFRRYDREANEAKRGTHRWGWFAVICGAVGLMLAAASPLLEEKAPNYFWSIVGELIGFTAILIGAGGFLLFNQKHRWLRSRLMTERLRQWHFQFIVRRGDLVSQVIAKPNTGKTDSFLKERQRLFVEFLATHEGKLDSQLSSLTGSLSHKEDWTVAASPSTAKGYQEDDVFEAVCKAYRTLRLRHQVQYAQHRLETTPKESLFSFSRWPPIAQLQVLERLEGFCFWSLIVISVVAVVGYLPIIADTNEPESLHFDSIGVGAICILILGFAIRTIEAGLGIQEEVGRLREYQSQTERLLHDFDQAESAQSRLEKMEKLELAAFDEMRHFLTANHEANFVL